MMHLRIPIYTLAVSILGTIFSMTPAQAEDRDSHWAFSAPTRTALPEVDSSWGRNPIDQFVMSKLKENQLKPATEADRITLLRRLSLDLTGLPPTLDEIALVEKDGSDDWYSKLVDRLLDSPHYGERWARHWLDSAQYADSDGFEKDKPRDVSSWRDWVINAFNADMPYDQFVIEQIAGDMLPNATQDQQVATGFLRNSMINEEGGIDPEQFRMEAMFNRMDIIGRSVLGLTVNCAQCHDHKYDPISHADYFRMFAFLNNAHEAMITVYSNQEQTFADQLEELIAQQENELKSQHPDWQSRMREWEETIGTMPEPKWSVLDLEFDDSSAGGQKFLLQEDGSYLAQGYSPARNQTKMTTTTDLKRITAVRLELLADQNLPRGGPGRSIYGTNALSEFALRYSTEGVAVKSYDKWKAVKIASAISDSNPPQRIMGPEFPLRDPKERLIGPVALAIDGNMDTAWTTNVDPGRRNQARYAIFRLEKPLKITDNMELLVRPSQNHGGWNNNENQNNNMGRFRISVTDSEQLPEVAVPYQVKAAIALPETERSASDEKVIFDYWRTTVLDYRSFNTAIDALWAAYPNGTTQLVYQERSMPRVTRVLDRGDFLSPLDEVKPGTPDFMHAMKVEGNPSRLDFAQWLVSPESPTTARTMVNRVWQQYFGRGLVETSDDFGTQGEMPSHPELLDWLSLEFIENGWSLKDLTRLIVHSATYRQSSAVTQEQLALDPKNRLLERGARFRVEGEIVRDIALSASGLLTPTVGGRSVYPPAPAYLFLPPASYGTKTWNVDTGPNRYRRGLYTFRFRSVQFPALQSFDAPSGDAPCTRRDVSNSPLQALTTLNETLFMECAAALASETILHGGRSDQERIAYAFRRCATRAPKAKDNQILLEFIEKQRERIQAGELKPEDIVPEIIAKDTEVAKDDLALWTLASRVMLNMDETIVRQ